jgi:hypothetical protein
MKIIIGKCLFKKNWSVLFEKLGGYENISIISALIV